MRGLLLALGVALTPAACRQGDASAPPAPTTEPTEVTITSPPSAVAPATPTTRQVIGPADRPAELVVPDETPTAAAPLLVVLHGYAYGPDDGDELFGATQQAAARQLFVLLPSGTTDRDGHRFWNASPACCNYGGLPVDDVAYLEGLVDDVAAAWPIDRKRIYVLGHSNGGFMAYRLACEMGDIAGIAVLAAADPLPDGECRPPQPLSVLHLHGTADRKVPFAGGELLAPVTGAAETVGRWARRNGCTTAMIDLAPIDLDVAQPGAETTVSAYEGCPSGVAVQLDTMEGSEHIPQLDHDSVGRNVIDWLLAHRR